MKKSQNIFQMSSFFFAGSLGIVDGGLDDDLARLEALVAEFWKYPAVLFIEITCLQM